MESLNGRPFHVAWLEPLMYRRITLHVAISDRIAIAYALKKDPAMIECKVPVRWADLGPRMGNGHLVDFAVVHYQC